MPMITVEFDDEKVTKEEVRALCVAMQKIVSGATGIEDVFVYANCSPIRVKVAPIEVFIQMSDHKIDDEGELVDQIEALLVEWKKENNFSKPVNLTLIPVHWKIKIGI